MISFDDFAKLEFKVGTILEAEAVEGSDKLLKFSVDLGEEAPRQILSGIKKWYKPEKLIGKQFIFVTNLEPRVMMGLQSQGMIMAADPKPSGLRLSDKPVLLKPASKVPVGSKVR